MKKDPRKFRDLQPEMTDLAKIIPQEEAKTNMEVRKGMSQKIKRIDQNHLHSYYKGCN